MTKNRSTKGRRVQIYDDGPSLMKSAGGQWATRQLKAAALAGQALSAGALRTLDTLRHEEWKFFDDVLINEALIRLVGVADLINAGLTRPVPNALGKTVFGYEKITFMDEAEVSLDGISRTQNDRQEFSLAQLPLPITHKDFFINLRTLSASREKGEPLDTTQVATAGRVVSEKAEKMLFQGGKTFGGLPIYGYTTFPDRNKTTFTDTKSWEDTSKTGESFMTDVTNALTALAEDRMYGPFMVYVPADAGINIENDYVITGAVGIARTIRQRLEAVQQIAGIRIADQLPSGNVLFVQMTSDNVVWVQGENLQTVQWDEYGGFEINFKAFQIAVPLIRSDAQGRSGIFHLYTA
jgi:uncharacterized linocin/CFP29 family protein